MSFKKSILISLTAVLIIFGITGCGNTKTDKSEVDKSPIKIGLLAPMTGDLANYGDQAQVAVNLAAEEINNAGGINGRKLEIITEDGQCDTTVALNAANKLILTDKVPAVMPLCSGETLAASPIAEQNKTIILSAASTNPQITDAGDYIFRLTPSDSFQGKFVAEYVYNNLNKRKVAILFNSDTEWSVGVKGVFKQRFIELGGQILVEDGLLSDATDYRSSILKIKNAQPDLIYFPSMVNAGIVGLKQIKEMGIDAPILGGDVWDDAKIPQTLGTAINGIRFTVMANKVLPKTFIDNMEKNPRGKNVNAYSPRFYDAVYILADIMRQVGTDPVKIKEKLYKLNNFSGIAENYTMDKNGDLANSSYTIKEFMNGKIVEAHDASSPTNSN